MHKRGHTAWAGPGLGDRDPTWLGPAGREAPKGSLGAWVEGSFRCWQSLGSPATFAHELTEPS